MRLFKPLALGFLWILVACSAAPQAPETKTIQFNDPFALINTLQESDDPFGIIGQVYPSFVFRSSAVLQEKNANGEVFFEVDSTTLLEQLDQNYYHIHRVPFDPVPSVEVIFNKGLIYLRPHSEETFYQVKQNSELTRLRKTILTELFGYYDMDALKSQPSKTENNQTCYHHQQNYLCFDVQTKLPVKGQISQPQPQSSHLLVSFVLEVGEEDIAVIKPEKVHSLRKHEKI